MAYKRVTRRATRVSGLAPIVNSIRRTQSQRRPVRYANPRPTSIPQWSYGPGPRTTIVNGYAAKVVPASGTVTVMVGPAGVGTVWYPQAAAISTTTGANDTSTCALYLSPLENSSPPVPSTQIGGQSYAGGGDTIGLAVPPMWPGYFIVAVWSGAVVGDLAALAIYGTQQVLAA